MGELEGEGQKDRLEVTPVLKISRAEEAGPELPICKAHLGDCLGDGRFPRPHETIQPEDVLDFFVHQPILKLEEDSLPCPLQTPLPVPRAVTGFISVIHPIQKNPFHVSLLKSYCM